MVAPQAAEPAIEQSKPQAGVEPAEAAPRCPVCGRREALLILDSVWYCAACGYASAGISGCT